MGYLTDSEKRLLFSALTREKGICKGIDEQKQDGILLTPIVESLERKFYYDRFEKQIRNSVIDDFSKKLKERLMDMQMAELQGKDMCPCHETGEPCQYMNHDIGCQYCAREQTIKDIEKIVEQMKRGTNETDI